MKIGIMQPYFFPYIGYWQLIDAVDKYVVYDDVNFISRGWIHRNRILDSGKPRYFNLPMLGASQNKLINEISLNPDPALKERNLRILKECYGHAPYYQTVCPVIEAILLCEEKNMARYLLRSIKIICTYLGIGTELIVSSDLDKDCSLKGQEKIIGICRLLGATDYYNAIGGMELYEPSAFKKYGIRLHFLRTEEFAYRQFGDNFLSNLSIIDVLMFNSRERAKDMLGRFTLIEKTGRG